MRIYDDMSLENFEFWGDTARSNAESLSSSDMDRLELMLEEMYPDGIDATALNDLFWFDFDTVKQWLGIVDHTDTDTDTDEDTDTEEE